MLFPEWVKADTRKNSYKDLLLPFLVILTTIAVTTISSNSRSLQTSSFFIASSLLGGVYFFNILLYLPVLFVIRIIRGDRKYRSLIYKCLSILLWSFIPLAFLWIGASIINLTLYKIPWSVFSNMFFWGKAIIIPLSLFYFYKKNSKENFFDSLIDSMLVAGFVLLLSLIKW